MSSWRVILNREDDEGSHKCEGNTQSGLCDHATIGGSLACARDDTRGARAASIGVDCTIYPTRVANADAAMTFKRNGSAIS